MRVFHFPLNIGENHVTRSPFWVLPMNDINFRLERELQFAFKGEQTAGTLFVGDVRYVVDRKRWCCHWSLSFVHDEVGHIWGDDPLDAIKCTLDFLSSLIRGSEEDGLIVWWKYQGDHAGLTFPQCEGRRWLEMPGQKPPAV